MNMQATNIPANSSITISELSDLVSLCTSTQTHQLKATTENATRTIQFCKKAILKISKTANKLPQVPGANGMDPTPKQVAIT
jgi:predicted DNA-binding ArsR family transcriptional regulator